MRYPRPGPRNVATRCRRTLAFVAVLLTTAPALSAQSVQLGDIRVVGAGRNARSRSSILPPIPGGFTFCRLNYYSNRREPLGQGWRTDYPDADHNLSLRLSQLTPTPISRWEDGSPGYAVVWATDPELFLCPMLFASDVGTADFNAQEIERLRAFFLKGGLLWVDDFWGSQSWRQWSSLIAEVLPEYPIVDLPLDHDLFSIVYHVTEIPQIPSIQHWRDSGGGTSEQGADSATPHLRAILDESGRILVIMTHNTDIADGWEREGDNYEFFSLFSPDAYAIGVNILVWRMTH